MLNNFASVTCFVGQFYRRFISAQNFNKTTPSAPKLTGVAVNLWFEARSNLMKTSFLRSLFCYEGDGLLRIPFLLRRFRIVKMLNNFASVTCFVRQFYRRFISAQNFNKTTPSAPKLTGVAVNLWFEARSNSNSPF